MIKEYNTVDGEQEITLVIEKSKFICALKGVRNEEEAKEFISIIKKKHSLATHNCYAYIADEVGYLQKFFDDGEPQGTAGIPMLETLKNNDLKKVVAVVTRYFGGIKLGTGGLARAYSNAVNECINSAKKIKCVWSTVFDFVLTYNEYSKILNCFNENYIKLLSTVFDDGVKIRIACKKEFENGFVAKISNVFCGKAVCEEVGESFIPFEC